MFLCFNSVVKSPTEQFVPGTNIQNVKKISNGQQGSIKQLFALGGPGGYEKAFTPATLFAELFFIYPVFANPQ